MKLYVLPIEKVCNAHCAFCITDFRLNASKEVLSLESLVKILVSQKFSKIEITGGGEPTLHPEIDQIITLCSQQAPTQIYTNGSHLDKLGSLDNLQTLCVSIAHNEMDKNRKIMGIKPDLDFLKEANCKVKFSLLLHKSGIHSIEEVRDYLGWAQSYAQEVVVRQLFEHAYEGNMVGEFVSSKKIFNELNPPEYHLTPHRNPVFSYEGIKVEFEYRSCACETDNPVLHADGRMHRGWTEEVINDFNRI
ncbi:MAG: radical SAM protein [Nanoarchaeota archaeon]|nr:radical SAM protein [Nanoarchaeota archaeon]